MGQRLLHYSRGVVARTGATFLLLNLWEPGGFLVSTLLAPGAREPANFNERFHASLELFSDSWRVGLLKSEITGGLDRPGRDRRRMAGRGCGAREPIAGRLTRLDVSPKQLTRCKTTSQQSRQTERRTSSPLEGLQTDEPSRQQPSVPSPLPTTVPSP